LKNLRVVVLVSPDPSDIYFANQLMKRVNVVGVFVERQYEHANLTKSVLKAVRLSLKPWQFIKRFAESKVVHHFSQKSADIDIAHFGKECRKLTHSDSCKIVYTEGVRQINSSKYVEQIKCLRPDVIALCGTSIIQDQIITFPPRGVLNLHGGLPQKYRGVWTTLWAMYNEEPEYIGSTVHFVDTGVDTGNIIYQGRPDITADDNPEILYTKVVKLGVEMMIQAIDDIENDKIESYPQKKLGNLYLEKMVTPEVLSKAWANVERGIIREYLKHKVERDRQVIDLMVGKFHEVS